MHVTQRPVPIAIERRFPLDLHKSDDAIRQLYESAKAAHWSPETDLHWDSFVAGAHDTAVLDAARRVWSRRAWVEYAALSETPALLIRFCLERDREADPKYFLTVRNTEEAWHVECFHRYATACGGYLDRPSNPAWEPVFNANLHRDALNAERALDAYVVTHCAFVDGLEHELMRAWLARSREPLAQALLERCLADRERHARFGWLYATRRATALDAAQRADVVAALVAHVETMEFAGYRCVGLATSIDARPEIDDLRTLARAGLGAASADTEVEVFASFLGQTRARLSGMGLDLPMLRHPRLGSV